MSLEFFTLSIGGTLLLLTNRSKYHVLSSTAIDFCSLLDND